LSLIFLRELLSFLLPYEVDIKNFRYPLFINQKIRKTNNG
jgi:hypothetical protein